MLICLILNTTYEKHICPLSLIIFTTQLFAQDKIYRKNGQVLKVKVIEVGSTEIKYKLPEAYEVALGIIRAGKNQSVDYYYNSAHLEKRNQFGVSASFGYKFNKLPDFLFWTPGLRI